MSGSRAPVGIRLDIQGAEKVRRELEAIGPAGEKALRALEKGALAADPALRGVASASDVANRAFAGMGGSLGRVGATFGGVSGVAGGLTAGFLALAAGAGVAAVGIAKAGDTATAVLARLASATGSASAAERAFEGLFRLSQRTGISVADSAGAFARFAVAAKEVGATNDQVLRLVGGLQKAGIVAGASAEETGAATQQLAQALASGVLQGDELRSLLENMPQLAQALAKELGVGLGQLRQMGSEGKLTADRVLPALIAAGEKLAAEFDKLPPTMGRAFGVLGAAMDNFASQLDKALGLSQAIAKAAMEAAAAVNAVQRYVAPTDRQASENDVSRTRARLEALRAGPAMDDGSDPARGYSAIQRAQLQAAATARQSALRQAESEHRAANDRLGEIERDAQQQRFGEYVTAQAKAADAARTRTAQEVREVVEANDKKLKATREYQEQLAKIARAETAGVTTLPGGAAFDATRARADALREYQDKLAKANEEAAKLAKALEAESKKRGGVIEKLTEQRIAAEQALSVQQAGVAGGKAMAEALEIESALRSASIGPIEKRTEAEKRAAAQIAETIKATNRAKEATKEHDKAIKEAEAFQERSYTAVANIAERAFERVGDAIVNAFVGGQGAAVSFGNIARGVLSSIVADIAKLALINPILNSVTGAAGSALRPTLGGAGFGFGGLGQTLGLGNIGETLGLTGPGGLLSSIGSSIGLTGAGGLLGATAITGWGTSTSAALGAMGGTYGPASLAQVQAFGGGGLFGGTGATFGSLLGGAGAGFGAGMLLNSLLGGNQTGGMVGSGAGALAGAALGSIIPGIGTLIGGLLGGAAGGGLGGLFGPGKSNQATAYRLTGTGAGGITTGFDGNAVGDQFVDPRGRAEFEQVRQSLTQINAYLTQRDLQVSGVRRVENGLDGNAAGGARNFNEAFSSLAFTGGSNADLNRGLTGRSFADPAALQAFVDGLIQTQDVISALNAAQVPAFSAALTALNDNFDAAGAKAREYGLAEDALNESRAKQIAALRAERSEQFRLAAVNLDIRDAAATGLDQQAEFLRATEAAAAETKNFAASLDALAATAEEKSALLVRLEATQAAERAAILAKSGAADKAAADKAAADAARSDAASAKSLLTELTLGRSSALAPEQQYFAGLTLLNNARQALDAGGSLADYTSAAQQVLPVARDYLGTSQRYAGLAAEVAGVLKDRGGDPANLSAILTAQVDGGDALRSLTASIGNATVGQLTALNAEVRRLASTIEALISRQRAG